MDDKVIVSNKSALTAKYGANGLAKIKTAIGDLIAADAARGIKSRLIYLDDATAMKKFHGKAVTDRRSARQNKEAIDKIFRATEPEYLLILGAPDWRQRARTLRARYLFWGKQEERNYPSSRQPWKGQAAVVATGFWGTIYDLESPPVLR